MANKEHERCIIVVGKNRSGTKWLTNMLCNHSQIFGAQTERSRGILETDMFHRMEKKFDLNYPDDYVAFIELWSLSEFFITCNGDKEYFYSLYPRPTDFYVLFEELMKTSRDKRNQAYWIQKTSPPEALRLLRYFKEANYVLIRRTILDVIKSNYKNQLSAGGTPNLITLTLESVYQSKLIDYIEAKASKSSSVDYSELRNNKVQALKKICADLGIAYEPKMLEESFQPNTSFKLHEERADVMSSRVQGVVCCIYTIANWLPRPVLRLLIYLKNMRNPMYDRHFVSGSFGRLKDKLKDKTIYG